MIRVYYHFLPIAYQRPGGVWWHRDMLTRELGAFLDGIAPMARGIRVCKEFPEHTWHNVEPPTSATVYKRST